MKKLFTLILSGILIMSSSLYAQKATIIHIDYNNKLASATFESVSADFCTVTDVIVKTGRTFEHDNGSGTPVNAPFTTLLIQSVNYCTLQVTYYADAEVVLGQGADISGNLTSASMDIHMPLFDQISQTTSDAHIVINWASTTGMITHQFTNSHINLKGLHFTEVSHGNYRLADATGSITINNGPNLIPDPGVFNYIIRGGVDDIYNFHPRMAETMPDAANTLSVYPNPATDVLHINTANVSRYSVVNMLGSVVAERATAGVITDDLNIADMKPGIYFLRLQTDAGEVIEKFVKE